MAAQVLDSNAPRNGPLDGSVRVEALRCYSELVERLLPGVGRKTANVVLNVVFGEPTMAVDTHIFRVGNRTGLAPGKNPLEVELGLLKRVPAEYMQHAHHWLILPDLRVVTSLLDMPCRWRLSLLPAKS